MKLANVCDTWRVLSLPKLAMKKNKTKTNTMMKMLPTAKPNKNFTKSKEKKRKSRTEKWRRKMTYLILCEWGLSFHALDQAQQFHARNDNGSGRFLWLTFHLRFSVPLPFSRLFWFRFIFFSASGMNEAKDEKSWRFVGERMKFH